MNSDELCRRTKAFAVAVIRLVKRLSHCSVTDIIGKQLVRSAASVAANYRAACRSRSKADFINKIGIVEEEADESLFWLELLVATKKVGEKDVMLLMDEADQLIRIFASTQITAKANRTAR